MIDEVEFAATKYKKAQGITVAAESVERSS